MQSSNFGCVLPCKVEKVSVNIINFFTESVSPRHGITFHNAAPACVEQGKYRTSNIHPSCFKNVKLPVR